MLHLHELHRVIGMNLLKHMLLLGLNKSSHLLFDRLLPKANLYEIYHEWLTQGVQIQLFLLKVQFSSKVKIATPQSFYIFIVGQTQS